MRYYQRVKYKKTWDCWGLNLSGQRVSDFQTQHKDLKLIQLCRNTCAHAVHPSNTKYTQMVLHLEASFTERVSFMCIKDMEQTPSKPNKVGWLLSIVCPPSMLIRQAIFFLYQNSSAPLWQKTCDTYQIIPKESSHLEQQLIPASGLNITPTFLSKSWS